MPQCTFKKEVVMLVVTTLALLLTGAPPAPQNPQPASQPSMLEASAAWSWTQRTDPFGRNGVTSFDATMPMMGVRLRGTAWYAELSGQLMFSSLANRNVVGSVRRDIFSTGPLRWGVNVEVADVRFRRDDFRSGDVLIGTNRTATVLMTGLSVGTGPYRGAHARVTALGGWYRNRYGSLVELPGFSGEEPLADDEVPVIGAHVVIDGITIGNRVEFGGSARYLRLSGNHASSIPDDEISGTASMNIRLFRIRGKSLFIGGFARFGPVGPSLLADKTFGLRGTWRLRK